MGDGEALAGTGPAAGDESAAGAKVNSWPPVRAVIFDWGGTLTPWHQVDLTRQWQVYAERYCDHQAEASALAERILEVERAAWKRAQLEGVSAQLEQVLAAAGVDTDQPGHAAAEAAYQEFWEPHTITDPQVGPLFAGLRERGVAVGVLSNTIWSREYHEQVFARDGVHQLIDAAAYTSELSHAKPHRIAFTAIRDRLGIEDSAACVYVGDRPYEDVHGAQRAGMRAILIPHSDIPPDQRVPVEVTPDAVVGDLLEILTVVDQWNA
jgi:putative hydrolase of the HAD superfamily